MRIASSVPPILLRLQAHQTSGASFCCSCRLKENREHAEAMRTRVPLSEKGEHAKMTSNRCQACGLVNFAGTVNCRRCQATIVWGAEGGAKSTRIQLVVLFQCRWRRSSASTLPGSSFLGELWDAVCRICFSLRANWKASKRTSHGFSRPGSPRHIHTRNPCDRIPHWVSPWNPSGAQG